MSSSASVISERSLPDLKHDMKRGIDDIAQECLVCGRHCRNRRALGNHVNKTHGHDLREYVLRYIVADASPPTCLCGCGQVTQWHVLSYTFNTYVSGHNRRGLLGRVVDRLRHAIAMHRRYDDDEPIVTRDEMVIMNHPALGGPGPHATEAEILPLMLSLVTQHIADHGRPYPPPVSSFAESIADVRRACRKMGGKLPSNSSAGSAYLKSVIHAYWDVQAGPMESFSDTRVLNAVTRYRLGLNTSRSYTYVLADGRRVDCNEHFDVSLKALRTGFVVRRNAVSWFKPAVAATLYERFIGGSMAPRVWDPSAGFGARLLGLAAVCPDATYIGCEPASQTHTGLCRLIDDARSVLPSFTACVVRQGSEMSLAGSIMDGEIDLVMTSPPYFDRERYFDEPGQCWRDFPTLSQWSTGYLIPTLKEAARVLKVGGHLVLNVSEERAPDVIAAASSIGFSRDPDHDISLSLGKDHFSRHRGVIADSHEPVLVFRP